ncbi:RagB/SusD family nutrient uptake outer membrane protein [Niabella sp. W65]|nr:RagB/SusD family nutrient uptake outer membrane protein [Niabella sp. W65]MCH7365332.1 RagB/SusD family nutrient uptake outer membrane protein [Niabella sp. W65]ULT41129.1 RagB/SusD family nutrient uptake outer membrane protein [Niabella sp. I65]
MNEIPRKWNERNYYYPIPLNDLQRNPNLKQNPGWE